MNFVLASAEISHHITWHGTMLAVVVDVCILVNFLAMLMCIFRLLRGPHLADRSIAVDSLGVQLVGLVILLSIKFQTLMFVDGILVLSLLGFAGTVAMAQYIGRPHLQRAQESAPSSGNP